MLFVLELCLCIRYFVLEKLLKLLLDRGFFNLVFIIIFLKFFWCLKVVFGELVKIIIILLVRGNKWVLFFLYLGLYLKRDNLNY